VKTLRILVAICVSLFSSAAFATVFSHIPTDRELIDRSDLVVVATVHDATSRQRNDGMIVTDYRLVVEQTLKGAARDTITVTEVGGVIGQRFTFIADSATYAPGEKVVTFLRMRTDGTYVTTSMSLGKFVFDRDVSGQAVLVRSSDELGSDTTRLAEPFEQFVKGDVRATYASRLPRVSPASVGTLATASQYCLSAGGFGVRWQGGESGATVTFEVSGTDPTGALGRGTAAWTNEPAAFINLTVGGSSLSTTPDPNDHHNVVYFGYTAADPAGAICDGGQACMIGSGDFTHTYKGETFVSINDADIIVRSVPSNQLDALMTHELGHAIGLKHANDPTAPNPTSGAIMSTPVNASLGSNLQSWDREAADTVYGAGVTSCTPPALGVAASATPSTINAGQSSQLSVGTPSGTAPFTFVWTAAGQPIGTNQQINVSPTVTTTYTVTITNSCGNITSNATVTVNPACTSPTISANPQSQNSNTPGQQVTLSVGATGGTQPYSYQWFTGSPGFGTPISNQNSATLSVSPTVTTTYYATVTSACGGTAATSAAATITVGTGCVPPQITLQPVSQSISSGSTASLSMGYSGSSGTVTWYQGTPNNRTVVVGSGQNFTTPPLTANNSYWAEIVNGCGNAQTVGVTITVISGPVCTAPTITLQPASQSISTGGTASLSMGYTGTSGTVTWYQGTPPVKTTPVGSTQNFTTTALTTNTSFWAEVVNSCGNAQTIAAVITVSPGNTCSNAAIVSHPVSGSIIVGGVATLSVSASGSSPLSYQWYQGAKGDTSKPVGTNSASFTSSPISANTSFWVRVTNTCNGTQTADSNAASITVTVSRHRGVRH
jgi:hypothetical protein